VLTKYKIIDNFANAKQEILFRQTSSVNFKLRFHHHVLIYKSVIKRLDFEVFINPDNWPFSFHDDILHWSTCATRCLQREQNRNEKKPENAWLTGMMRHTHFESSSVRKLKKNAKSIQIGYNDFRGPNLSVDTPKPRPAERTRARCIFERNRAAINRPDATAGKRTRTANTCT